MRTFNEINEIMTNLPSEDYYAIEKGCLMANENGDFFLLDDLSMRIDLTPAEMLMMW